MAARRREDLDLRRRLDTSIKELRCVGGVAGSAGSAMRRTDAGDRVNIIVTSTFYTISRAGAESCDVDFAAAFDPKGMIPVKLQQMFKGKTGQFFIG
eukprot:gene22108-31272_t